MYMSCIALLASFPGSLPLRIPHPHCVFYDLTFDKNSSEFKGQDARGGGAGNKAIAFTFMYMYT